MALDRGRRATTGFLSDFSTFIMRGNVVDLAVAVILGGAFGKIIESLVADIITPAILNPAMKAAGVDKLQDLSAGGVQYGLFLAAIINFLVIAFCMFILVRMFEEAKQSAIRKQEVEAAETPDPVLESQQNLTHAIQQLTTVMQQRS